MTVVVVVVVVIQEGRKKGLRFCFSRTSSCILISILRDASATRWGKEKRGVVG